jgi:2-phosphosulfolactate phosphatase
VEFDLGNSPREFTRARVEGRRIAATTTNGTRALRACAGARTVLAAAFVNLEATRQWLAQTPHETVLLVCSGTGPRPAYEDLLGAGALVDALARTAGGTQPWDASLVARRLFLDTGADLAAAVASSANGRRLLSIPDLAPDVALCSARDTHPIVARLDGDGWVRRI